MFRPRTIQLTRRFYKRGYSTTTSIEEEQLAGTVPPHSLYLVLRTPESPRTMPSRTTSPLRLNLQRKLLTRGGLVNFMHTSDSRAFALSARYASPQIREMAAASEGEDALPEDEDGEECYDAVAFSPGRLPLHLKNVSRETADERLELLNLVHSALPPLRRFAKGEYDGPVHLYVCTHGERDCRCGTHGAALADALKTEVRRRRKAEAGGVWDRVVVGEVAHVGGHKHAANMLVFPHGDWLGQLRAEHVPELLDLLASDPFTNQEGETRPPLMPEHWRGRMGLTPDEQCKLLGSR